MGNKNQTNYIQRRMAMGMVSCRKRMGNRMEVATGKSDIKKKLARNLDCTKKISPS